MSVVATCNGSYHNSTPTSLTSRPGMDDQAIHLRPPNSSNPPQPARVRRRSLNISHFNALQNAVSNLSRIDDFNLEELGYGFFSDVFKVTHKQTGNVMALKRNKNTNTKMNILREVQLMNRLSHPNILKFKGVCVHEGQLHALTEFLNGGDLDQLVTKKNLPLPWKQRLQLALDVAKGMKYLHSVRIFHRDLSAKNCLVRVSIGPKDKKKYSCVVADLGLAEKIPSTAAEEERLSIVGTPYIMAPEVLKGKPYNEKADIFSFGLLVCQLIARVSSDPEDLPRTQDFGLARDLFQKIISSPPVSGCPQSTSHSPPEDFLQLAFDCCQLIPTVRPSFNAIVSRLEDMIEKLKKTKKVGRSSSFEVAAETTTRADGKSQNNTDELDTMNGEPKSPTKKRSQSASSVRFSRSYSDISRELLTHAANMVASSSTDDVTTNDDSYANPFATLKLLNGEKMKLTDEPSLGLLELTFDLTTTDKLKSSWKNQTTDNVSKKQRSKSVYSMDEITNYTASPPQSPSALRVPASFLRSDRRGCRSVPHSPRGSASEETLVPCQGCHFQRALNRAMILSPLGNNLASWWCSRHRFRKDSARNRRQSLAGVMSVLSCNIQGVRRCISLPDLSRISSLFNPSEWGEKISLQKIDSPRPLRSRTSNEIFHHRSSKEPIIEESEAELLHLDSDLLHSKEKHGTLSNPASNASSSADDVLLSANNSSVSVIDSIISEPSEPSPGKSDSLPNRTDTPVSSSSSSSGCSSILSVTLHSGEVTRQKRIESKRGSIPQASSPGKQYCNSTSNETPPKFHNRDSGYDDGVLEEQHHSAVSSPGCEVFHPLPFKIPEEVPVTLMP